MKLIFCVTLSLILGNFIVASSPTKEFEKFSEDDDRTVFDDVNPDCVYLILNNLDFDGLANAAHVDEKLSTLAADVFRLKYSHLQMIIGDKFRLSNNNNASKVSKTQIQLKKDDQMLSNIFLHFGDLIKNLKLINDGQENSVQSELVGKLISEYSSEALRGIEIEHNATEMLEFITKPLINVQNVTFTENDMNFKNIRNFNEIFPAVRRLSLNSLTDCELAYFNHHMPHLEHVSLGESYKCNCSTLTDIFMKNLQIQSISLYRADSEFIQELNKLFPQLETLSLTQIEITNITTESYSSVGFSLGLPEYELPTNLHFTQLQNLEIDHSQHPFDRCDIILNAHKHLRRLSLRHYNLKDHKFQHLTENLKDLVEFTLTRLTDYWNPDYVSSNAIVNFLRSNGKVKQFNIINYPKDCVDELQEQLKQEWSTRIIDGGLSFERINQL